jgi:signal transduction histidine kinase
VTDSNDRDTGLDALRRRAEQQVQQSEGSGESMSTEELRSALHDLNVHREELRLQNEELRRTEAELQASRTQYFELYHLAPIAYLTVDGDAGIQEANLSAAALFLESRHALLRSNLRRYVHGKSLRELMRLLEESEPDEPVHRELVLTRADHTTFFARLDVSVSNPEDSGERTRRRVTITDLTERRVFEEAQRRAKEELELRVAERTAELEAKNQALQGEIAERRRTEAKLAENEAKLRRLAAEMTRIEERERRRFAQDVHDTVSQTLAFAKMRLGMLPYVADDEERKAEVSRIAGIISDAIAGTRALMREIAPAGMYDALPESIQSFIDHFGPEHGLEVDLDDDAVEKPLNADTRALVFRAVRELLVNVAKHAQARRAEVSLRVQQGALHVAVRDDGVGFPPNYSMDAAGFGLYSIRERLQHLGGGMEVSSGRPPWTTCVGLHVPLTPETAQ